MTHIDAGMTKVEELVKDSEGNVIEEGDTIRFSYGIPPVGVEARVADRNGKLVALTPEHKPNECDLTKLKRHVGYFCKVPPRKDDPREIEENLFRARDALEARNV